MDRPMKTTNTQKADTQAGDTARASSGRRRRVWLNTVILFAAAYAVLCLLMCGCQRSFMYFPDPHLPTPSAVGLAGVEVVQLHTEDGLKLVAWYAPNEGARYTAIVFHGNAGNIGMRAFLVHALHDAGCSVLLVEYRGYGGNPGSPSEEGFYKDARAAWKYLESREDVDASRLIVFGKSIGTGPATQLATERQPAGLVLDSPFTSAIDVGVHHYWYLPVRWLIWDKFDNLSKIDEVKCPVLVIHGDRDRIIPIEHGRKVFQFAEEPKEFVVVEGAGHNSVVDTDRQGYVSAIKRLLETAEKRVSNDE